MSAFILFAISVLGGIGICLTQSMPAIIATLSIETSFALFFPACRGYRKAWMFILFCGTMIPVHLCWFCPSLILYIYADDVFTVASVIFGVCCLFSIELILLLFMVHRFEILHDRGKKYSD